MSDQRRVLDPTPCIIRHVRRARADDPAGRVVQVLRAQFVAAEGKELEALAGEDGWQAAQVTAALADDGEFVIRFPNGQGADGVEHGSRFALLTDPNYRMGEEWLEVYREPMDQEHLLFVGTPAAAKTDRGAIELRGPDLLALYTLARSDDFDVWHHAPRDVFEFYTRLPYAALAQRLTPYPGSTALTAAGWTVANVAADASTGATAVGGAGAGSLTHALAGVEADAWTADARMDWRSPSSPAAANTTSLTVRLAGGTTIVLTYAPGDNGLVTLTGTALGHALGTGAGGVYMARSRSRLTMPAGCSLRLIARGEWLYGFVEGELLVRARRATFAAPDQVQVATSAGVTVAVRSVRAFSVGPFGLRGATKGDYRLPGAPTPGGLRGRYWAEAGARAAVGDSAFGAAVLDPLIEPSDSRLDATLNWPAANPPAWLPPAARPPSGTFSARWTGAIYLDLSTDRRLRLTLPTTAGRIFVGRTMRGQEALAWAGGSTHATADLRATLGSTSGWFPIVIEAYSHDAEAGLILEESANGGGVWSVVPSSKLSPLGIYEAQHRRESHREILDAIAAGFGYQYAVEPRTLESGEFPGQIIPRVRQGRDTDKVLTTEQAADLAAEIDAADAYDALLVDAAGIADPKGTEQLTAEVLDDANAGTHLFLSSGYESLADVSEPALLEQRAASLLALHSGPNEQVAARPSEASEELVDTFPLTGALGRLRWRPGDGLRLALPDLRVVDRTPRQLLTITWPLYQDGSGAPTTAWRQRPRGLAPIILRGLRAAMSAQRNYQGQVSILQGALGGTSGKDFYSRMPLPPNRDDVTELWLDVTYADGVARTIEVNGANTGVTVTAPGRYPLTRWLAEAGGAGGGSVSNVVYARLLPATAGEYVLGARVRI